MWQAIYLRNFLGQALASAKGAAGLLEYRGYLAYGMLDDDTGTLHGEVPATGDIITLEGNSRDELAQAFRDFVDDSLKVCEEHGRTPRQP